MSLKHAILGFLALQPLSGYDLKKTFDTSVAHFWPADQSQIYRTLRQMYKEGLVTREVEKREDLIDRKLYQISAAGEAELDAWLADPGPLTETREPFLIRLFFGGRLDNETLLALLRAEKAQVDAVYTLLRSYHGISMQAFTDLPEAARRQGFLQMLTLEFGILGNGVHAAWLADIIDRLERGDLTPRSLAELAGLALGEGDAETAE